MIRVVDQTVRGAVESEVARLQGMTQGGAFGGQPVLMDPAGRGHSQVMGQGRSDVSFPTREEINKKVQLALSGQNRI